ncbi:oxidoreductase [Iocasia frigidifontis]|uniref:Oxidoreductase n=1 Tax=Iocasia fonsfrigidae TaxID=2682810 RepID=A0A8A7KGY5_9FIRM|nr:phosphogluconate dehydrogenase C-terminal domain-containing protein [Iocasia fonsfrigidae]QTL99345.1 oxidoreductase [Iocasia fonsfrigidae]
MSKQLTISIIGAAGKMGTRITNNLLKSNYNLLFCENGETGIAKLKERGLTNTETEKAIPQSDLVILSVPDNLIGKISEEIVSMMKKDATLLLLDPAAAYAGEVSLRDDCSFVVVHPGHPPLYRAQDNLEAYNDFFGGVARQDVVAALFQGKEKHFEIGKKVAKDMWAPVDNVYDVTVDQMILLEPAAVEVAGGSVVYLIRDVIGELTERGIPKEAAQSFVLGHLRTVLAIVLDVIPAPVSDACKLAIEQNYNRIIKEDWKEIFESDVVEETVKGMLGLKK